MSLTMKAAIDQPVNDQAQTPRATLDDVLAALVYHSSALTHSDLQVEELVERVGSLVLYSLHADSIRVALRDARTGATVTFSDSRVRSSAASESFLFHGR